MFVVRYSINIIVKFICANRKILMTSNSELRINPNSSIAQIAETTLLDKQIVTSIYVIGASDLRTEGQQG